ncbi:glycosyltransferase family A protein [Amycolatopsis endophytica]|uniref:GT2 family glycosyltransferase n=1 Tax=Amycolatopsis endophytica TaxID=860233 RepID=A0A853B458_9PSEU|nr:glycosyltransferase family 2 protein [Amycolatopsis endophytica]NYI89799.1 GT2 family glycosyltransferase [Amycolatopsis endophytica]
MSVDVLIPTRNRPSELAVTLSGLAAQDFADFGVHVADQSEEDASYDAAPAQAMVRVLRHRGHPVHLSRNLPRRGLAQQRFYLLEQSSADHVLFLDDDVWLEPDVITRLHSAITELDCGVVGNAVTGLSYVDDRRPHELEPYEEWPGRPEPEQVTPGTREWRRWTLHNAANPSHLSERVADRPRWTAYKVAWIGGCVMFDREALVSVGGFGFWRELPPEHCGEDVLAQLKVAAKYGAAGILPTGAVHLESPTTVVNRDTEAFDVVSP